MYKRLYGLMIFVVLLACHSSEGVINQDKYLREIIVGEGGGFTGEYIEFVLKENGNVYKKDFQFNRYILYKKLDKETTAYFFKKTDELSIEGIDFNQKGNMNYYLELKSNNVSVNRIEWCARLKVPVQSVIELHKELMKELAKQD